eukprot:scaffold327915_cov59-Attheya_sp.AAC.1
MPSINCSAPCGYGWQKDGGMVESDPVRYCAGDGGCDVVCDREWCNWNVPQPIQWLTVTFENENVLMLDENVFLVEMDVTVVITQLSNG